MSLGLKDVLGVNTGNISGKKGEQKTLGTAEEDGTLKAQNFIEKTVNQEILNSFITWSNVLEYNENTYVFHDSKVYKSLVASGNKNKNPSEPDSTYWNLIATTDKDINDEMSKILSFDADMVRKEIIAWGLGRVAADYQLDIDNTESYWDQWTSGLDFGISAINTLSNFFSGSSTLRSLVKVGDSYVMMAQDAAEGSDNTNFLYKFSANKKSDEEKKLGYNFYHKPMYNSPILLCIQSLCQAADQAMEEIADDKLEDTSAERQILYAKSIPKIKGSREEEIVQNNIVDRVALYIANYYMISSFVAPYKTKALGRLKRKYITLKIENDEFVREIADNITTPINYVGYEYKGYKIFNDYKLKVAATETTLFKIHEYNRYINPNSNNKENEGNLKPKQPYRLLLPMTAPANKSLNELENSDIKLFLEVVNVTPNDTTNGAEVEVKIKLPEAIEASLSSSIVHSGFNFKFTIPEEIYDISNTTNLTQGSGNTLKLTPAGKAAQQVFVDIAQNFVKAINPILEANPITGYAEMLTNAAPDLMDSSKLGIECWRSIKFHQNNTKKGEFERAADCYGAIPTVLEHSLAYIKSGHYFDDANSDDNFIKDI
jgi:hypothetical protein